MNKKNKLFFGVFILGLFGVFNGAFLKVNGNENADISLIIGMIFKLVAVLGFIFVNRKNLSLLFK